MRKPSKAVAILKWKLKRGKEPTLENLLAVLADTRRMIIPPGFRRPPQDPYRLAPATSVDDFEKNVLLEAIGELRSEVESIRNAEEQELAEMVLDAYHRAAEVAAANPDDAALATAVAKIREAVERAFGGAIPPRTSHA